MHSIHKPPAGVQYFGEIHLFVESMVAIVTLPQDRGKDGSGASLCSAAQHLIANQFQADTSQAYMCSFWAHSRYFFQCLKCGLDAKQAGLDLFVTAGICSC